MKFNKDRYIIGRTKVGCSSWCGFNILVHLVLLARARQSRALEYKILRACTRATFEQCPIVLIICIVNIVMYNTLLYCSCNCINGKETMNIRQVHRISMFAYVRTGSDSLICHDMLRSTIVVHYHPLISSSVAHVTNSTTAKLIQFRVF